MTQRKYGLPFSSDSLVLPKTSGVGTKSKAPNFYS